MPCEMKLKYVTDKGLDMLKQGFDQNLQRYYDNDQEYFLHWLAGQDCLLESSYLVEDFRDNLTYCGDSSQDHNHDDFSNIRTVYSAMRHLPAYVMLDDRLWAGINHTIMWDYIRKRRGKEAFEGDCGALRNKIYNSFFTHTAHGKKRGTYVNCVSRLWWAGHLTYDASAQDPYALTREMCNTGFASTIVLLSSSNIMSRKPTMLSLLRTVKRMRQGGRVVRRADVVAGVRYLNLVAGITLLDLMTEPEIEEMLDHFYVKYYDELISG